jgi:glycosyltransferase involved in cell wall biosynthesis
MRFLMLNWRDPFSPLAGGAERVTQAYLGELAWRGHEVAWFAFAHPALGRSDTVDGIRIVRGGGMGTAILAARRWAAAQPKFDLVIDQHHGIPWFAHLWCGTRTISYIHEVLGPIWNSFYPWPLSAIGRRQESWTHWLYRRQTFFTASSDTRRKLHEHGICEVRIIPYGVNTTALPSLPPKPLQAPLRLAVVCRLAPNKRVDHAVRTVKALQQRGVAASLRIVGSGTEETNLRRLIADLQLGASAQLTGPLSEADKDAVLRDAHFLLHTSQREGWGLNVIEANAMGTPAAVYPVEGLTESTLNGETGILSDDESPESLADALCGVTRRG